MAIDAIGYDEKFLTIYRAAIEQKAVQTDIDKALTRLYSLESLMNRIRDTIIATQNQRP